MLRTTKASQVRILLLVIVSSINELVALTPGEVTVRFTNTVNGQDVETVAPVGTNLLNLGDEAGVRLPRACRNGLCNSCICDVVDQATGTRTTIKACSTKIMPHSDGSPIIVDVYRMQKKQDQVLAKSMSRFDDGWETSFVPDYKRGQTSSTSGETYTQQGVPPWEQYSGARATQTKAISEQDSNFDPSNPIFDDPLAAPWDRIW